MSFSKIQMFDKSFCSSFETRQDQHDHTVETEVHGSLTTKRRIGRSDEKSRYHCSWYMTLISISHTYTLTHTHTQTVDHGKTTLVDSLLKTCGALDSSSPSERNEERVMDSMDQEKERGITISSKITGMSWKGTQLNIVDTPGHADFGGEVERVLSLVDGVVIVVDASDGPNTQTRYVTSKALERGLQPLIVVNKVDRDTADIVKTENEVFDLFIALNANDDQLEAPFVYASARSGWAVDPTAEDYEEIEVGKDLEGGSMAPLLDAILTHLPEPSLSSEENIKASCRFLVSMMSHDKYLGRLVTGKIEGKHNLKLGDEIRVLKRDGQRGGT